jgi:murein DD-endopeptidase
MSTATRANRLASRWTRAFALLLGASALPIPIRAQSAAHAPKPVTPPLDITVPIVPTAFQAGGKWHLVYELHVANLGKWECALTRLEVLTDATLPKVLATFTDAALDAMISHPGSSAEEKIQQGAKPAPENGQKSKIAPGIFAVIYMWVTFDHLEDVPPSIRHRLAMKIGDYPEAITLDGLPLAVNKNPVVVISAPLRGENWLAVNGPSNSSAHRRALIPINGRAYISQRFAIDWTQLYPDGKTYHGDPKDNRSYRAYGAEVHAVADGVVTETKDGIQQNIPNQPPAVPMTLETMGGNHVIMDIGNGLFAFYAHMQPGSLRVKVGDKVHRGDVLGLLGNSGNSSEPHLHFQICNANSELGSEGLPYALPSFELLGHGSTFKSSDSHAAPMKVEMQVPLEDDVVRFMP